MVYEFARRLVKHDPSIPERLRDCDVFELSTVFLRSGASYVGEYEKRVSALLKVLTANPKVILFVDEAHSMFQSGMEHRGPFTDANEAFKQSIIKGEISIIGCTTTAEYRHYIEPDKALRERFTLVTVEEPSPEETREIMAARRPGLEEYYGVEIPEERVHCEKHLLRNVLQIVLTDAKSPQGVPHIGELLIEEGPEVRSRGAHPARFASRHPDPSRKNARRPKARRRMRREGCSKRRRC